MLSPLRRLLERVRSRFPRRGPAVDGQPATTETPSAEAGPAPRRNPATPIRLTLTRRQIPVLIGLVVANLVLIIGATAYISYTVASDSLAAATPTPLSAQAVDTEIAQRLPTIPVVVPAQPTGPTPTAPANPFSVGGTIFYAYRHNGHTNLWAHVLGRPEPVRLTAGPWDDRDPSVSPDGKWLAFASRREGSWNIYLLNLSNGQVRRLTNGRDYKANPTWSPDSQFVAFETYRNNNLDVAITSLSGGDLIYLTDNAAADYQPTWSPKGREIIFVSMRSGTPELWVRSLDDPYDSNARRLTQAPEVFASNPAYSPDGTQVLYTDANSPQGIIYARSAADPNDKPREAGQGQHPIWSPDGTSLLSVIPEEAGPGYLAAAPLGQPGLAQILYKPIDGHLDAITWSPVVLPATLPGTMGQAAQASDAALWAEVISKPSQGGPPISLVTLPDVNAPDPRLSDRVDDAFAGLRRSIASLTGWDALATLDNALLPLRAPPPPSAEADSWLKAGRAFDLTQAYAQGGWLVVTREDYGFRTYWRVWLRARFQDGSLGEPLRAPAWDFSARYSGRPKPYDEGGEYFKAIPPGYFVDFTALAQDYGWARAQAQTNWRSFFPGILYWRFEHRDGLTWLQAMQEVYTAAQVATQTLVPSPTGTPTITLTPTITGTPTQTDTPTPTNTRTPRPTLTPTDTRTPRPTTTPVPSATPRPIIITVVITQPPPGPVETDQPGPGSK